VNDKMTVLYVSTGANKIKVVQVDDDTGNLVRVVQTVECVVDPLPETYDGKPLPASGVFQPVTEWVEKHPKFNLVYAFTSFWSSAPAVITTFRIVNENDGTISKLGRVSTESLQATFATFSPDQSHLVVAHHNDGNVVFFDCTKDQALNSPVKILITPELKEGTRNSKFPNCLPSIHHVSYSPDGKYLLTSDVSQQGRVWTYAVDSHGIPTNDTPTSLFKPSIITPVDPWFGWLVKKALSIPDYRIRRTVVHPNGGFVYLLMETTPVLQVYEIDRNGKILGDCLQEVPTIDPSYLQNSYFGSSKWHGISMNAPAELYVTDTEVLVSNRCLKVPYVGYGESSIRIFQMTDNGAKLVLKQVLETPASVRHFWKNEDCTKLFSGINMGTPKVIETFVRDSPNEEFRKVGEANVEMDVMCIAPM
jgi:6-phosphogluconolactonase (cycloisomerase 2 family)